MGTTTQSLHCTASPSITEVPGSLLHVHCSECGLDYFVPKR